MALLNGVLYPIFDCLNYIKLREEALYQLHFLVLLTHPKIGQNEQNAATILQILARFPLITAQLLVFSEKTLKKK
jgi:hypothetical protein